MVSQWTVLSSLRQITSIEAEGAVFGLSLCLTCLEEIRAKLKDGSDEHDPCLERAAAGLAYYKLTLKRISEDGAASFKAGDVSVSQNPAGLLAIAAKVRDEALAGAAPLLMDDLFLFKGINI